MVSKNFRVYFLFSVVIFSLFIASVSLSQKSDNIAKKLSNPLGYISFPFQSNIDFNIPKHNGFKWTMNLLPIIPVELNKNLNVINRLVVPVISQKDIFKNTSQTGLGDILINSFLSPKSESLVWGIGPTIYFPSGFPEELTSKKWAAGPDLVVMKTEGRLIIGALLFHIWSFGGNESRPDFSYTYFQPVSLYNFNDGWGIGLSAEISNEAKKKVTNGSVIFQGSKLMNISGQLVNFVLGPKYYFGNFNKPEVGIRASVNLLFP